VVYERIYLVRAQKLSH